MYKCQFPNCSYQTDQRTQIHEHHINPRQHGGSNKKNNKIWLCPNHHMRIYVDIKNTRGIHGQKSDSSIVLLGHYQSTQGKVLHYIENNEEKYGYL